MRPVRSCTISTIDVNENGDSLGGGSNIEPPTKRKKLSSLLNSIENDANLSTTSIFLSDRSSNLRNRGLLKPNPKYSEDTEDEEEKIRKKRGRKPGKRAATAATKEEKPIVSNKLIPLMVPSPGTAARFGCPICGNTYSAKNGFERHMEKHAGKNRYGCQYCSHTSLRKDNLKVHYLAKHADYEFNPVYPVGEDHRVSDGNLTNVSANSSLATPALARALSENLNQMPVQDSSFNLPPGFADIINNAVQQDANEYIQEEVVQHVQDETLTANTMPLSEEVVSSSLEVPIPASETVIEESEEFVPDTVAANVEMSASTPTTIHRNRAPSEPYDQVSEEPLHSNTVPQETLLRNIKLEINEAMLTKAANVTTSNNEPIKSQFPFPPPRIPKREMIVPPTAAVPPARDCKPIMPIPCLRKVKHEVIEIEDDTPERLIVDETEVIQCVIKKYANNQPNKLFIVWDEDFSQDVAYSVVKNSSNCILALRKCSYTSFGKFCSSFVKGSVECPQIRLESERDKSLHLLAFGARTQRMIREESSYRTHAALEMDLTALSAKGEIMHIVRYTEDPYSWSNQLVKQLNGTVVRTNKFFN